MNPQILLVSNNKTLRFLMVDALSMINVDVIESPTADAALLALKAFESDQPFDLVLTDIRMPGEIDGLELVQIIGVQWPLIPVILCSGCMPMQVKHLPSNVAFLPKPWTQNQLFSLVIQSLQSTSQTGDISVNASPSQGLPDEPKL